jgi:dTDP-4-dehydrorhamnose 3,5-epimerase-like enzyme
MDEGRSVLVPRDVAHGYCATSDQAALAYLISSPFNPSAEFEIQPLDTDLKVPWPLTGEAILSAKDAAAPSFASRRDAGDLPLFF